MLEKYSKEELEDLFAACLVCTPESTMYLVAKSIAKACRFGLKVALAGEKGDSYNRVIELIQHLRVPYGEPPEAELLAFEPYRKEDRIVDGTLYIWVPGNPDRLEDIGVLVSFNIRYSIAAYLDRNIQISEPKVDSFYLLLIWYLHFNRDIIASPLEGRIQLDLINSEDTKLFTIHESNESYWAELDAAYMQLRQLNEVLQMYLGFTPDYQYFSQKAPHLGVLYHKFNDKTRSIVNKEVQEQRLAELHGERVKTPATWYPSLMRHMEYSLDQIELVGSNIAKLHYYNRIPDKDSRKFVIDCLKMRIEGKSEEEILEFSAMGTFDFYNNWMGSIGLTIRLQEGYINAFERWKRARTELGLSASDAEGSVKQVEQTTGTVETKQEPAPEISEVNTGKLLVKFSKDFRSINIDGTKLGASSKRAHVLRILYDNWVQGTPSISVWTVMKSVSPEATSKNLRKLFSDKVLYDALIESGSSKGTVQLKESYDYSVPLDDDWEEE